MALPFEFVFSAQGLLPLALFVVIYFLCVVCFHASFPKLPEKLALTGARTSISAKQGDRTGRNDGVLGEPGPI